MKDFFVGLPGVCFAVAALRLKPACDVSMLHQSLATRSLHFCSSLFKCILNQAVASCCTERNCIHYDCSSPQSCQSPSPTMQEHQNTPNMRNRLRRLRRRVLRLSRSPPLIKRLFRRLTAYTTPLTNQTPCPHPYNLLHSPLIPHQHS